MKPEDQNSFQSPLLFEHRRFLSDPTPFPSTTKHQTSRTRGHRQFQMGLDINKSRDKRSRSRLVERKQRRESRLQSRMRSHRERQKALTLNAERPSINMATGNVPKELRVTFKADIPDNIECSESSEPSEPSQSSGSTERECNEMTDLHCLSLESDDIHCSSDDDLVSSVSSDSSEDEFILMTDDEEECEMIIHRTFPKAVEWESM